MARVCLGEIMDTKKKNIITMLILVSIATTIYVFAVMKAISS